MGGPTSGATPRPLAVAGNGGDRAGDQTETSTPAGVRQVLEVLGGVLSGRPTTQDQVAAARDAAVRLVAEVSEVEPQALMYKCTAGLGLSAAEFDELVLRWVARGDGPLSSRLQLAGHTQADREAVQRFFAVDRSQPEGQGAEHGAVEPRSPTPAEELAAQSVTEDSPFLRYWHGHYRPDFLAALRRAGAQCLADVLTLHPKEFQSLAPGRDWDGLLRVFQGRLEHALELVNSKPNASEVQRWLPAASSGGTGTPHHVRTPAIDKVGIAEVAQIHKEPPTTEAEADDDEAALRLLANWGLDKLPPPDAASNVEVLGEFGVSDHVITCLRRAGAKRVGEVLCIPARRLAEQNGVGTRKLMQFAALRLWLQRKEAVRPGTGREHPFRQHPPPEGPVPVDSVLRCPLRALFGTARQTPSDEPRAADLQMTVAELGLDGDSLAQLRGAGIWAEDSLDDFGALTLEYLCTHVPASGGLSRLFDAIDGSGMFRPGCFTRALLANADAAVKVDLLEGIARPPWVTLGFPPAEAKLLSTAFGPTNDHGTLGPERKLLEAADSVGSGLQSLLLLYRTLRYQARRGQRPAEAGRWWALLQDEGLESFLNALAHEVLPSREAEVWLGRQGIGTTDSKRRTLEEFAGRFGLSRERVRQVEAQASDRLPKAWSRHPCKDGMARTVTAAASGCLGLASAHAFAGALQAQFACTQSPSTMSLHALQHLVGDFGLKGSTLRHPRRCLALENRVRCLVVFRVGAITGEKISVVDLVFDLNKALGERCWADGPRDRSVIPCCGAAEGSANMPRAYVEAILAEIRPPVLDGDWIWDPDWVAIRHGPTKRKAIRASLRAIGKPTHYSKIGAFLREHSVKFGQTTDHSVHTGLCNYTEFVPTERGEYGLAEWGVDRHLTVADRIEKLLKSKGEPMLLREVLEELAEEGVPELNVNAALSQNPLRFVVSGEWGNRMVRLAESLRTAAKQDAVQSTKTPILALRDDDEPPILFGE
ncbi:MAG: hypothetical protein AUJ96_23610 [Armatimonadetes bacterium CG2_30_66_41]|nr:MAG: hypothetical protein AUJ96_23610 [Armatimonadetes bacterium CG2_30_66_41]PIU91328.1 MAG: hypothetical protein COS65_22265 [Armatimonadetes bacterium CG06_land_8_20_14_3_00_66_21]